MRSWFHGDWCYGKHEKKVHRQNCMAVKRAVYGCKYSITIFIVTLKKTHSWNQLFFGNKHNTDDRITQTLDNEFSLQNKYSTLQRMDDYHSLCDKSRYPTSRDG